MKRLAATALIVLIDSRCLPSFRILARDGRAMESHLLDDLAVPPLSSLSRRSENLADLVPGDPDRPSRNDGVNDLTPTTCTSQHSTLKEVFLHRTLVTLAGFVPLGQFVGVFKVMMRAVAPAAYKAARASPQM